MFKEKVEKMLNEMGGGAGIEVSAEADDLRMEASIEVLGGKFKLNGINRDGSFPVKCYKFSAKGYMDGMSDVKGEVLDIVGYLEDGWFDEVKKNIHNAMSDVNEDIFKPASSREVVSRRKKLPVTIHLSLGGYGEVSDVVGGGYIRGGPQAFNFEWTDIPINCEVESDELDVPTFEIMATIHGKLNKLGVKWYRDIFNPPDYDPKDYEGEEDMPEDMYWDMYWEDMEMEWGAK